MTDVTIHIHVAHYTRVQQFRMMYFESRGQSSNSGKSDKRESQNE